MPLATPNRIKKKNVIRYNGDICLVNECVVRTPPNNASYAQMELRSLKTGKKLPVRCSIGEQFEVLENNFKNLEFSYENQGEYVFMDQTTFDTIEIPRDIIEDVVDFLVPNQIYEVMFVEGNPIAISLRASIDMKVIDAPEAVRGNTSGNVTKQAKVETGLMVNVPLFVKIGDVISVDTETKKYLGRA